MSKRLSQNDPRWSRKSIGKSSFKVGGHGCTLTSISMGLSKLFPREWNEKKWNPGDLAATLVFTDDKHPLGGGLLIWGDNRKKFAQMGIEFIGRYHGYTEKDKKTIRELSNSEDHFVIVEVATRRGGRHWLLVQGYAFTWRGFGLATDDPWDGKRLYKTTGYLAPYKRVLGYAVFKRNTL